MRVTIERVGLPDTANAVDADDFLGFVDVGNACSFQLWGNDDFVDDAADQLAWYRPNEFSLRMPYLARLDGLPVGRLLVRIPLDEDATGAELEVQVLPSARRHGIGSALLEHGEALAANGGRVDLSVYTEHLLAGVPEHARLARASSGEAGLPADDDATRFALHHGYHLGQVEIVSELRLPVEADLRTRLETQTGAAGSGYRVRSWWRHCPDDLVAGYAAAIERMSLDVPHEGVVRHAEKWDVARVRDSERRAIDRGKPWLTTAAVAPDGRLAGYTEIAVAEGSRTVEQGDTLILPEHRGHRLGMLVKLANLRRLGTLAPGVGRVITWNADENGPMRAINDALGFRPYALDGNWQKRLP
jgi:GNAT superfamily N-acetyltransferase